MEIPEDEFLAHCAEHGVTPDDDQLRSYFIECLSNEPDLTSCVRISRPIQKRMISQPIQVRSH